MPLEQARAFRPAAPGVENFTDAELVAWCNSVAAINYDKIRELYGLTPEQEGPVEALVDDLRKGSLRYWRQRIQEVRDVRDRRGHLARTDPARKTISTPIFQAMRDNPLHIASVCYEVEKVLPREQVEAARSRAPFLDRQVKSREDPWDDYVITFCDVYRLDVGQRYTAWSISRETKPSGSFDQLTERLNTISTTTQVQAAGPHMSCLTEAARRVRALTSRPTSSPTTRPRRGAQ